MTGADRREIADRLRTLLRLDSPAQLDEVAQELGVEELSLRMSVDADSPFPTVDVLSAVARRYGVDPTWLLTGVYDLETHRRALGDPESLADAIRQVAGVTHSLPVANPADHSARLHLL